MKLSKLQITNFQSIQDSTEFEIGDINCLVGKNEAGKTAILKAVHKLRPFIESEGNFDSVEDYPRRFVSDYQESVKSGSKKPAQVVRATYELEDEDIKAVRSTFGKDCLIASKPIVSLAKDYANQSTFRDLEVNLDATLKHLVRSAGLTSELTTGMLEKNSSSEMLALIRESEATEASKKLIPLLESIERNSLEDVIFKDVLETRIPKFLYFDEYYQMNGQDNIQALSQRKQENKLLASDYPLLGLIEIAGLNLDELVDPQRTQALLSKLEAAENQLTDKVLKYWSQNKHLRMKFDPRPGQPGDPVGMTSGMNIWGRVIDTIHNVSTGLGTRSRGFVWFFSFLAWYSQLRRQNVNLILLLDEPGLSLHAKAQDDLLIYFEQELKPHHQVIYTTHSPFMVDPSKFERVRIVQDLSIEKDASELSDDQKGTKVINEVLDATPDSLFPLQGALGYEIYQTLFIGPNSLVVEGVSDLLYIQTISSHLQSLGETGLDKAWTITPVGGSDKVPTFVALIGAKKHLNVAVLIDFQKKDQQGIENLYKRKLLEKKKVLTFAEFSPGEEADIEDMFSPSLYLGLINGEFGTSISVSDLPKGSDRILSKVEAYLKDNPLPSSISFNHFRPARYFVEHFAKMKNDLTVTQLDRFRKAFDALNKLL